MGTMLQIPFKAPVTRFITPACRFALKIGLTPNLVTAIGSFLVIITSLVAYPNGHFFWGTIAICIFSLSDLFDGTMARISAKGGSPWGALGLMVSYVKARAESLDIACNGGLAERTERLMLVLLGIGLHGLGVPYALAFGIWILAVLSLITVAQRLLMVYQETA